MKKNLAVVFFMSMNFICYSNVPTKKSKIVVFTSKGGNAHMSACAVLKDALPECEIKLVNPIYDFFHNVFDGEEWHSALVRNGYIRSVNFIVHYPAKAFFGFKSKTFEKRFTTFLQEEKPDLLISVIPFLNYPAYMATKQCNIPFMFITLDADLETWIFNMEKCRDHNFVMSVQAKTPRMLKQLEKAKIPLRCVREVGAPLRKDFFTPKNKKEIKKEWNIPENKKVVMLMRGGTGSNKLVDYVRMLVKSNKDLHLLVCIGSNNKLIKSFNRIKNSGRVTFSVIPFTSKISELMSVSDLLITSPSPTVCNEAMYMKVPFLIDMTSTCLFWEKANIDWMKMNGEGNIFKRMNQLNKSVAELLEKKENCLLQKPKLKPTLCFNDEIRKLVLEKLKN